MCSFNDRMILRYRSSDVSFMSLIRTDVLEGIPSSIYVGAM